MLCIKNALKKRRKKKHAEAEVTKANSGISRLSNKAGGKGPDSSWGALSKDN